ncbi:YggS family pyridoxal phosphate-dependent enzyme [Thermodesulfobium narugense]|uniref:YggS family pyridoxal phosphate-dependent enzyme n=1 Tax=Thermodesulfobium narugense TaxID=184064 RepID=UPI00068EF164|nr:YggS family pyridoxal phosphate-dependent enzyme [Thermodesulfobium narugense]
MPLDWKKKLQENVQKVKERVQKAKEAAKRKDEVFILPVTKTKSTEIIRALIEMGFNVFGENRVREAKEKIKELSNVKFEMIGHLQTNKVKDALDIFTRIQSVDSLKLLTEINERAAKKKIVMPVLVEINISGESQKYGFLPGEVMNLFRVTSSLRFVNIEGLMGMASLTNDTDKIRKEFSTLRILYERLNAEGYNLNVLSMGMTDDFEVAIMEGSNMVRIGRAFFEGLEI